MIERTEFGLALQATSEDRDAARLVGIRPQRMFAVAWGLGAALVAIAGAILVNFFSVYPQVGLQFTVLAYAIVALGGFGSILGTLLAALLVGVIQSVTVVYLPPAFKDAFVFASYLLIGLFRPAGPVRAVLAVRRGSRWCSGLWRRSIYPIPLQIQGTTYYQTVGFLVLRQRDARRRLERHRGLGGAVRLRAAGVLRDRCLHRGAALREAGLECVARAAGRRRGRGR